MNLARNGRREKKRVGDFVQTVAGMLFIMTPELKRDILKTTKGEKEQRSEQPDFNFGFVQSQAGHSAQNLQRRL